MYAFGIAGGGRRVLAMTPVIDMDDPLAAEQPRRDTPPQPSGDAGSGTPAGAAAEPKRRGPRKQDAQLKLDLKEIEEKLTELLKAPAIPMDVAGDTWPARHVENRAPALAHAVAEAARNNTQLRERLLKFLRVQDNGTLLVASLAYALPVLLYYGVLPIPPPIRAQIPVPPREQAREASIVDHMREEEERLASRRGPAQDSNGAQGAPRTEDWQSTAPQAQARTPPAI
jgi:hypothetical protein